MILVKIINLNYLSEIKAFNLNFNIENTMSTCQTTGFLLGGEGVDAVVLTTIK
jgi:hypothetical protein